jgi:hypothetical protein
MFGFGFLAVLPKILVSYIVGLGIEFAWAQGSTKRYRKVTSYQESLFH